MKRKQSIPVITLALLMLTGCVSQPPEAAPDAVPTVTQEADSDTQPHQIPGECRLDAAGCAVIGPGETIRIGMVGPLSGDYESYGTDIFRGGLIAIDDYGTYLDWDFELFAGDSQGDPEQAIEIAENMVEDPHVVAMAGHIFSGETAATIPIYEDASLPMLSPSATNPDLTQLGSSVFNRIAQSDVEQARYAARLMYGESGVKRIAVLTDGTGYGNDLASVMIREFTRYSGEVLLVMQVDNLGVDEPFDPKPLIDLFDAGTPVEGIYYGGYDVTGARIVSAIYQETEFADVLFVGPDGINGANFIRLAGEQSEGVIATSPVPPPLEPRIAFDETYEQAYGIKPGVLSPYTWYGYDAVGVLIFAVKQVAIVGRDGVLYVPRTALVTVVRNTDSYPGLTGDITCSSIGECRSGVPTLFVVRDGEWGILNP